MRKIRKPSREKRMQGEIEALDKSMEALAEAGEDLLKSKFISKKVVKGKWEYKYKEGKKRKTVEGEGQKLTRVEKVNLLNKESVKNYQIEMRVKAKFGGAIKAKEAKAEFSKQLKEAGVRTSEEIREERKKLTPELVNKSNAARNKRRKLKKSRKRKLKRGK